MKIESVSFYTAAWCSVCKRTWPWVQKLAAAQGKSVRKVDIDKEPAPSWLQSIPTVVIKFEDGQELVLSPTQLNKETFVNALKMGERND